MNDICHDFSSSEKDEIDFIIVPFTLEEDKVIQSWIQCKRIGVEGG